MPYVAPTTITHTTVPSHVAGEVYPAADYQTLVSDVNQMGSGYNTIVNDILQFAPMVQGVFTTEAARNAAITSPTEGMHVYLTAPASASGTGTTVTGVKQVYNGSAWVTTSPIMGVVATNETTNSGSYVALATTGPVVTIETGTTAMVRLSANMFTGAATRYAYMSFAVSGATTLAAAEYGVLSGSPGTSLGNQIEKTIYISGLTAGVNTFTCMYRCDINTVGFQNRSITVAGLA